MSISVEVSISDDLTAEIGESSDDEVPEPELIQTWASAAYLNKTPAIASFLVTTAGEIKNLNKQYRNQDKPTNVLSFPMFTPEEVDICLLGDIVLCASVIHQQAKQQQKSVLSHWAHMVVHGMLHLQGFDHINDNEAQEMETLEIEILGQLDFSNPYQTTTENSPAAEINEVTQNEA